jgi:hypothetical protein
LHRLEPARVLVGTDIAAADAIVAGFVRVALPATAAAIGRDSVGVDAGAAAAGLSGPAVLPLVPTASPPFLAPPPRVGDVGAGRERKPGSQAKGIAQRAAPGGDRGEESG